MGKRIVWICIILMLFATPVLAYDINQESGITVSDVVLVMRHVLNIEQLTQEQQARADINQDGRIDIADVTLLMRMALNAAEAPSKAVEITPTTSEVAAEAPSQAVDKVLFPRHNTHVFTQQVIITNKGNDTSSNIQVSIPMLQNSSPYQTTVLVTDYKEATASFDLQPQEQKIIEIKYQITNYTLTVEGDHSLLYSIYQNHVGAGNCRDLARNFIAECHSNNIQAREVVGFARPQRGDITIGDLKGCRHSWAEVYIDNLGWMPIDLTFGYFLELPHTSHIIETYYDESIDINYSGGSLTAEWNNTLEN